MLSKSPNIADRLQAVIDSRCFNWESDEKTLREAVQFIKNLPVVRASAHSHAIESAYQAGYESGCKKGFKAAMEIAA